MIGLPARLRGPARIVNALSIDATGTLPRLGLAGALHA
jgi:hypothetical protein